MLFLPEEIRRPLSWEVMLPNLSELRAPIVQAEDEILTVAKLRETGEWSFAVLRAPDSRSVETDL